MSCYHPLRGVVKGQEFLAVGCGKCVGCRLEYSRQWAVRCYHEAQLQAENAFVTLTYAPERLPPGGTLVRRDTQLFVKRLRKHFAPRRVRFFLCGEYGSHGLRPHYHALLFGIDFPDKLFYFTTEAGERIYTSEVLSGLWSLGFATTGAVTFKSAAYVARYVVKKISDVDGGWKPYSVDAETGEVLARLPEFVGMSLKPGIGEGWLSRYRDDVYPSDEVVVQGRLMKPPRYYDKLLERGAPDVLEGIKGERRRSSWARLVDETPRRRADREVVKVAQVGFLKRSFQEDL